MQYSKSAAIVLKRKPDSAPRVLVTASTIKKNATPTNTEYPAIVEDGTTFVKVNSIITVIPMSDD